MRAIHYSFIADKTYSIYNSTRLLSILPSPVRVGVYIYSYNKTTLLYCTVLTVQYTYVLCEDDINTYNLVDINMDICINS